MSTDYRGWSDEEQLVQYLAEFSFGRNEARIYLAALGRPPLRVAELAELPRPLIIYAGSMRAYLNVEPA